ncbi:flagellar basal body-associated protein [Chthonomonas calidirosea]|uniref:Flagellar protein FliL n=1 Tax=Chthonomonas calidirosea (strain DSM 23976 / ICMP 18418 / T49) TaxID=1303518 RepID=S0EZ19_CHTCT|nr:flagellar basal body-associated FliL family protein [Chthonomonas calidirosea]CCW35907.1 Flagellar basal body-associated protein [Chthonomonas calidirosea T49]CEK17860.1 flagellar basal body-associated protein [Chthonomonas calidirosea]CEK17861.1 flagellar basal body-associated protein [Chthonomonas calidirosea]CEK18892.1 flagellar basal body-associated protein [Chthonomonas calidirosea]
MVAKPEMRQQAVEQVEEAPKKRSKRPLLLFGGLVAVLVVALLVFHMMGGKKGAAKNETKKELKVSYYLPLDDFLVNLSGSDDHYLKAGITLGMTQNISQDEAKDKTAPIRDAIITVLSHKTLADVSKEGAKEALKKEIQEKVNEALSGQDVAAVYFTSFATQ